MMTPSGEHEKRFAESQRKPSMAGYQARVRKGVVVILETGPENPDLEVELRQ